VATRTNLIKRSKIRNALEVRDTARMRERGPNVVDQLFFNELLAIPDAVEYFATAIGVTVCWRIRRKPA